MYDVPVLIRQLRVLLFGRKWKVVIVFETFVDEAIYASFFWLWRGRCPQIVGLQGMFFLCMYNWQTLTGQGYYCLSVFMALPN